MLKYGIVFIYTPLQPWGWNRLELFANGLDPFPRSSVAPDGESQYRQFFFILLTTSEAAQPLLLAKWPNSSLTPL